MSNINCYYYSLLSPIEREAYDIIKNQLMLKKSNIIIHNEIDISKLITAIELDNPELYYVSFSSIKLFEGKNNIKLEFSINDYDDDALKKVESVIVNNARFFLSDFDKVRYIHNYLAYNVKYDMDYATKIIAYNEQIRKGTHDVIIDIDSDSHIYGALVEDSAVCGGIAKAAVYLLRKLNVGAMVVTGTTKYASGIFDVNTSHAWTLCKMGNNYYHLDITSDLYKVDIDDIMYNFTCVNDEIMKKYYNYELFVNACSLKEYYYYKYNLIANNDCELEKIIDSFDYNNSYFCLCYNGTKSDTDLANMVLEKIYQKTGRMISVLSLKMFNYYYFKVVKDLSNK